MDNRKTIGFCRCFILTVLISFIFPQLKKYACTITAIWFIFWKSPLSDGLIDIINTNPFWRFGRVVDYTDYIALSILPAAKTYIERDTKIYYCRRLALIRSFALGVALIALTSTSYLRTCYSAEGTVYIGKTYDLKVPKDTVLKRLEKLGYQTRFFPKDSTNGYYSIENIIVETNDRKLCQNIDTIKQLTFFFHSLGVGNEKMSIMEVTFSDTLQITDWRRLKVLSRKYNRITKDLFAKEITK